MTNATFDSGLYPQVAVIKAAHRFSGTHAVRVEHAENQVTVTLTHRSGGESDILADLFDAVVDETLREVIHARTAALHDVLVRAAFLPVQAIA